MMSRNPAVEPVTVVVASTDPTPTLEASLARFADEAGPLGEVVLVDASGDGESEGLARRSANVRVLRRPKGLLAPELWRDGLLATEAPLVAFSTARMVPRRGWLAALEGRLRSTGAAGVGGPIEPGPELSPAGRAVALLRYAGYFPPLPDPSRVEPPGDNALYRRDRLMEVRSAWLDGFWEVEVHRALRDRGESLAMAGRAVVTFEGGVRLARTARQRWSHARRYGAGRSAGLGPVARLGRMAAAPMVPSVLLARILAALKARRMPLSPWLPALPALAALASVWAMGEAFGTWAGSGGAHSNVRRPLSPTLPHKGGGSKKDGIGRGPLDLRRPPLPNPPPRGGREPEKTLPLSNRPPCGVGRGTEA